MQRPQAVASPSEARGPQRAPLKGSEEGKRGRTTRLGQLASTGNWKLPKAESGAQTFLGLCRLLLGSLRLRQTMDGKNVIMLRLPELHSVHACVCVCVYIYIYMLAPPLDQPFT